MDIDNLQYRDTDDRFFSLHDCRADQAVINGGVLSFFFPDGIWIAPGHPGNPTGKMVRTGLARVDFLLLNGARHRGNVWDDWEDVSFHVFRNLWLGLSIRREWRLIKLLYWLNTRKGQLEFVSRYDGYQGRIYECCLWQEKKPYHRDCQLMISGQQPVYRWNEIRGDCEW